MQKNTLHQDSIRSLKKIMNDPANKKSKDRIRALILIKKEYPFQEIAEVLDYSRSWIYKLYENYLAKGIDGILKQKRTGADTLLSSDQIIKFYEIVLNGPGDSELLSRYRIVDLIDIVREKWGVEYSIGGMHGLLKKMLLSHKTYRPHHPKNDPEVMAEWKKKPKNSLIKKRKSMMRSNSGIRMKQDMDKKELPQESGIQKG